MRAACPAPSIRSASRSSPPPSWRPAGPCRRRSPPRISTASSIPSACERYNRYATIGENLLFGKPIGDAFQEDRLSGHPFVRAILEANELTKPLARMGLSIATSMIEIFADIPDGSPLFERFSFFSAADRPYFQDLVDRQERAAAQRPDRPGSGSA